MSSLPPPGEKEAGLKTSAAIEARLQSDVNCAGDWFGDGKWEVLEKPRDRWTARAKVTQEPPGGTRRVWANFSNEENTQSKNGVMKE